MPKRPVDMRDGAEDGSPTDAVEALGLGGWNAYVEARWKAAREYRDSRRAAEESQPGSVMATAIHNHRGEPRTNVDVLVAIAGTLEGVVGKHTGRRSAKGTYLKVMYAPPWFLHFSKGTEIDVPDEDLDWYDDVYPCGPLEAPPDAPAKEPVHDPMPYAVETSIATLMQDTDGKRPTLYVPPEHKGRVLRLFGGHTMDDFDKLYGFNEKIGAPFPKCFNSMMYYMNNTSLGELRDQWSKLSHDALLSDLFNIVQSAVRSRAGEKIWLE